MEPVDFPRGFVPKTPPTHPQPNNKSPSKISPFRSPRAGNNNDEIQNLQSIDDFSKNYQLSKTLLNTINSLCTQILLLCGCVISNKHNINYVLLNYFSQHKNAVDSIYSSIHNNFKLIHPLPAFILHIIKYTIIQRYALPQLNKYELLSFNSNSSQQKISTTNSASEKVKNVLQDLHFEIYECREKCIKTIVSKSFKLSEHLFTVLLKISGVSHKTANTFSKYFLRSLHNFWACSQIKQHLNLQDKWLKAIDEIHKKSQQAPSSVIESTGSIDSEVDDIITNLCCALECKHRVERNFLIFKCIQNIASFCFSSIEFAFKLPGEQFQNHKLLSKFCVSNLNDYFPWLNILYLLYPFCPKITLKIQYIVLNLAEHVFKKFYKSEEYSWKGYKISLHIHIIELTCDIKNIIFVFSEKILWLPYRNSQAPNNNFYTRLRKHKEKSLETTQQKIKELKHQYNKLQVDDINLMLKFITLNDITTRVNNLLKTSQSPLKLKNFFLQHLSFDISTDDLNTLQTHIESLFSLSAEDFISTYNPPITYNPLFSDFPPLPDL